MLDIMNPIAIDQLSFMDDIIPPVGLIYILEQESIY